MVETVLLRCSLVLGEVSICVVSKIITGPQSTKNLVPGGKPVLPFKREQSASSSRLGLPCENQEGAQHGCVSSASVHGAILHIRISHRRKEILLCVGSFESSTTSPVPLPKNRYYYSVVGKTGMLQDTRN